MQIVLRLFSQLLKIQCGLYQLPIHGVCSVAVEMVQLFITTTKPSPENRVLKTLEEA